MRLRPLEDITFEKEEKNSFSTSFIQFTLIMFMTIVILSIENNID